ncbi:MAG: ABC transporter permease, partial [Acidobacteriaceae bacterium]|nr:ABC transporter permease [Acidobacteriaceae bacterium]
MRAGWILFVRLMLRPLLRERVRTALTVFAVALGVGVVVAIDLAGQAAAGSFHSSLESLTGKGDLLITAPGGIDQNLLGRLASMPYSFVLTPRIESFAHVNGEGEAIPFIGLDVIGNAAEGELVNSSVSQLANLLTATNPVWVGTKLRLRSGDRVRLLINDEQRQFTVAGVLKPQAGEIGEENVIVADIGLAQMVTGRRGRLDSIEVRVPPGRSVDAWRALLLQQLPAGVAVDPQGTRTEENRKMLAAFRWNLRVLSYIALVVGAFLIYNTISISVVRRRNEIGVVRALGADRGFVMSAFLAEALFLGIAGSVAGLLLGRAMAIGAVQLIGNTVEALYVSSQPAPVQFSVSSVVTGLGLGLAISVLAALAPAFEASRVMPVEAMERGREEYVAAVRSRRTL